MSAEQTTVRRQVDRETDDLDRYRHCRRVSCWDIPADVVICAFRFRFCGILLLVVLFIFEAKKRKEVINAGF